MEKRTCAYCLATVRLGPTGAPARHGWKRGDSGPGCPGSGYPVFEASPEGFFAAAAAAEALLASPPVLGDSGERAKARTLLQAGRDLLQQLHPGASS